MADAFSSIRIEVAERGYAFRDTLLHELTTERLATALGSPVSFNPETPVHELTPKPAQEASPNTYSGHYGLANFPLHTDMANWHEPPRYLMLRCIVGAPDVATTVADPSHMIELVGLSNLARALMKPRRKVAGHISLLPLARRTAGGILFRWDERYLVPASEAGKIYAERAQAEIAKLPKSLIQLDRPSATVIIDNWRMLHGRTTVPDSARSRRIERVYLTSIER